MGMILNCSIKQQYLDMIVKGAKKVEYREMSDYWVKKICDMSAYSDKYGEDVQELKQALEKGEVKLETKDYDRIRFWCAGQVLTYEIKDIRIYDGHKLFAISLGKQVSKGVS